MTDRRRVVLYNPDAVFFAMPLALLAIGSALDPTRFDVVIVDARLEADPIARLVQESRDALAVGVTVLTGAPIRDALRASRAVKAAHPGVAVIWGGWHPSLFPLETLEEPSVDAVVVGQGEDTFAAAVTALATAGGFADCEGLVWRDGGDIRQGGARPMRDVNAFPPLDYDLIPVDTYFARKRRRQLDYISSQGCRFRCAFCADPTVYNRAWSGLDPARIGEELQDLSRRFGVEDVGFQDETFFTSARRVEAICQQLLDRNLGLTWMATMRADQACRLDEAQFALARRAGLRTVMIGVESGSQELLDWMQKDARLEQVLEAAERCLRHGIGAIFNFIVGFPGETPTQMAQTLALAKRLRAMSPTFDTPIFYYRPYPGTRLAAAAAAADYRFPQTLDEWADFDYVGDRGPWVTQDTWEHVERFKFYTRHAFGPSSPARLPLRAAARWRCRNDRYGWPIEQRMAAWLRPAPRVS